MRKQALQARRCLKIRRISTAIHDRLTRWPLFGQYDHILAYHPLGTEIDVLPLTGALPGKSWYLPRVVSDRELAFHRFNTGDVLVPHAYGMLEPLPTAARFKSGEPGIILVPGLMFDRLGTRLGYGKGYYDLFLKTEPGLIRVGICPEALLAETLPDEPWDVRMQYLVTENGILEVTG